jgi:dephospho-CoA kinase
MLKALVVCGQICSGKSSVISYLSRIYNWDIISFSTYIKKLAAAKNLPPTRDVYQQLGHQIFTNTVPSEFLRAAITASNPVSSVHLFDSVRHLQILEEIRQTYSVTTVIYLRATDEVRYQRFLSRANVGDSILSFEDFLRMNKQPVECSITAIADYADLIIDSTNSIETVIERIEQVLQEFKSTIPFPLPDDQILCSLTENADHRQVN